MTELVHVMWYDTVVFALSQGGRPYFQPAPTIAQAVGWVISEDSLFLEIRSAFAEQFYEDRTIFSLYIPKGSICYRATLVDPSGSAQDWREPVPQSNVAGSEPKETQVDQGPAEEPDSDLAAAKLNYLLGLGGQATTAKIKSWKHPAVPLATQVVDPPRAESYKSTDYGQSEPITKPEPEKSYNEQGIEAPSSMPDAKIRRHAENYGYVTASIGSVPDPLHNLQDAAAPSSSTVPVENVAAPSTNDLTGDK